MKAIQVRAFGDPEVLQLVDLPDPETGPGQILVKVEAVGVNPVDTYIRSGVYTFAPPLPYTPGIDAAGTVEACGKGVWKVAPGDRVYTAGSLSGAYASMTLCGTAQVFRLPDKVSFGQGAALGIPYGTAYRALFHRAQARAGETVLVHGASGGVGIAAVQMARAAGLTVIGTAGSEAGERLVAEHGAHHVLNHHDATHFAEARERSGGAGVDIVVEMLADVNLGADLSVLAPRGRVVIVGSRGPAQIVPRDLMTIDADIRGMSLVNLTDQERASIHAAIYAGLENGTLNPVVSQEMPLAEAARAHHDVIESSTLGKIVLIP